jgi:hypothetical protein
MLAARKKLPNSYLKAALISESLLNIKRNGHLLNIEAMDMRLFLFCDRLRLYIDVSVDRPGLQTAREALQEQLSAIRSVPERRGKGFKTLSERKLMVSGMEAYEIVTWIEQYKGKIPGLNIISRDMFILDEDRYYHFSINIYEGDIGKTFSQEVDHLLESIEKIP